MKQACNTCTASFQTQQDTPKEPSLCPACSVAHDDALAEEKKKSESGKESDHTSSQ